MVAKIIAIRDAWGRVRESVRDAHPVRERVPLLVRGLVKGHVAEVAQTDVLDVKDAHLVRDVLELALIHARVVVGLAPTRVLVDVLEHANHRAVVSQNKNKGEKLWKLLKFKLTNLIRQE